MRRLFGGAAFQAWLAVRLLACLWTLIAFTTPSVLAHPSMSSLAHNQHAPTLHSGATLAGGVAFRILPLADSITWGYLSSNGNGYREHLCTRLTSGGNKDVRFVGSQVSCSMANGNNEGHPGTVISQTSTFFTSAGGLRSCQP